MLGIAKVKQPFTYYDFDVDLGGWTNIGGGTNVWAVGGAGRSPDLGIQNLPQYVSPDVWSTRDDSTSVLWLRSPQFQIRISASLTFALTGGKHGTPPANESEVPTGEGATAGGYQFVGLRDVLTGDFVLTAQKDVNPNGTAWIWAGWTEAQLAPYLNDGKNYTLDAIDQYVGGWGWFGLSRTRIPGW